MLLNFTDYRYYTSLASTPEHDRRQYFAGVTYQKTLIASTDEIDRFLSERFDEGCDVEIVNVTDEQGTVLYCWMTDSSGGATLHTQGTTNCIAKACQHSIELCTTKALWLALADAQRRLGSMKNKIDFSLDDDCDDLFIEE